MFNIVCDIHYVKHSVHVKVFCKVLRNGVRAEFSLTLATRGIELRGMQGEALKGHLDMLLLAALENRPAHGYAVVETLRQRSGGTFDLPEGTLYPALHRLEGAGLVTSAWSEETGRRRRVYQLTAKGRRSLEQKQSEWRTFVQAVNGVVEGMA